jgi:hypothetical protein
MKIDKGVITRQKKRLAKLSEKDLLCRVGSARHLWRRVLPDWDPGVTGVMPVAYQCDRCLTVKRTEIDKRYGIILGKPRYEYPDSYKLKRQESDGTEQLVSSNAVRAVSAAMEVTANILPVNIDEA